MARSAAPQLVGRGTQASIFRPPNPDDGRPDLDPSVASLRIFRRGTPSATWPATRHGSSARPFVRVLATSLFVFLTLLPVVAVTQQVLFLIAASLLGQATVLAERYLLPALPLDPVYAGAGLRILGGIQPSGLGVAGWPGWALHRAVPGAFDSPDLVAPGAIVSALLAPGATVAARALATLMATTLSLAVLVGLVTRVRITALRLSLDMARVWLLLGLVRETALDVRELDATGLPFAFAALAPVTAGGQRALLTRQLEALPEPLVELATGLAAVLACLALTMGPGLLIRLARPLQRWSMTRGRGRRLVAPKRRGRFDVRPALRMTGVGLPRFVGLAALAGIVVLTPLDVAGSGRPSSTASNAAPGAALSSADVTLDVVGAAPAASSVTSADDGTESGFTSSTDAGAPATSVQVAAVSVVASTSPATSLHADGQAATPLPTAPPTPVAATPTPLSSRGAGGSVVAVRGGGYRYTFSVNGTPTVVQGMGYNPWYTKLGPDERRLRYLRDFAAMREIGVNTIEGWFQEQFDEITLGEAHRQGLMAILPFELNQDYDYSDPAIKARFRDEITAWVLRYRDHPALLMWGPGNEVMHRLIFPTVVQGKRDPAQAKRADDFAAFYVELIDLIHQLDPDHPVVYRDAEDLYFARIRQALLRDGQRRPWFIYGTNVYTQRLAEVIQSWPTQGLDAPLLISEFSPGGVGPAERPRMLGWYWSTIRAHPERVVGGVVYTWATGGPEDLDRVFGLTDETGRPVDGSLAALRRLFRTDEVGRGGAS